MVKFLTSKQFLVPAILLISVIARAETAPNDAAPETWTVGGHVYSDKALAVRAVMAAGKPVEVKHTRCEILTNKLSFKACPKNKQTAFANQQFQGLGKTE